MPNPIRTGVVFENVGFQYPGADGWAVRNMSFALHAGETLAPGQVLVVWLRGEEPLKNVPRSAREEGHQVVSLEPSGERWRLLIQKGEAPGCP